jgi:hypothetical protein
LALYSERVGKRRHIAFQYLHRHMDGPEAQPLLSPRRSLHDPLVILSSSFDRPHIFEILFSRRRFLLFAFLLSSFIILSSLLFV